MGVAKRSLKTKISSFFFPTLDTASNRDSHHHGPDALCWGSGAPPENEDRPLSAKKLGRNRSILRSGRHISRTQQWRRAFSAVPWCTLVSDHNDPSIGGVAPGRHAP